MASEKIDLLMMGPTKSTIIDGLSPRFNLHKANDVDTLKALVPGIRCFHSDNSSLPWRTA